MSKSFRVLTVLMAAVLTMSLSVSYAVGPAAVSAADSASDLQKKLDDLQKQSKQIQTQLAADKNDLAKQTDYQKSLDLQIQNTTAQIENLTDQIDLVQGQIDSKNADIAAKEKQIEDKQAAMSDRFEQLKLRLRAIAMSGNLSSLQMLFSSEEYEDYLVKDEVAKRFSENDQKLIDEMNTELTGINADKQQLEDDKSELSGQMDQLASLKADSDSKKSDLDKMSAENTALINKLQNNINAANTELASSSKEMADLSNQITKLLQATKSTGNYTSGTMFWPVPAVHNISSPFGPRWGTIHTGIDIANGSVPVYGQNIVAAADGVVIFVSPNASSGYGNYVIIDHGKDSQGRDIATLYAHQSRILCKKGDQVVGGQTVIGLVGATGHVTGPHLHFEVRVNGTPVDPVGNGYVSPTKK